MNWKISYAIGFHPWEDTDQEFFRSLASLLEREEQRAAESHQEHIAESERVAGELVVEREKLEALQNEKAGFLAEAETARGVVRETEEALRTVQQEFSRVKHRLETLQELDEKRAVYAPEVQKLFAEQGNIGVELKGVLADYLRVDAGAEKVSEGVKQMAEASSEQSKKSMEEAKAAMEKVGEKTKAAAAEAEAKIKAATDEAVEKAAKAAEDAKNKAKEATAPE